MKMSGTKCDVVHFNIFELIKLKNVIICRKSQLILLKIHWENAVCYQNMVFNVHHNISIEPISMCIFCHMGKNASLRINVFGESAKQIDTLCCVCVCVCVCVYIYIYIYREREREL